MSSEKEAKFKVENHRALLASLKKTRAEFLGKFLQTDLYFDKPDGSLRAGDNGLRIRTMEPLVLPRHAGKRASGSKSLRAGEDLRPQITFKGPRQPGKIKIRPEFQTYLDDAAPMLQILRAAGLITILTIQKRRASYRLRTPRGPCRIELDELPYLGTFVEVEGPSEEAIAAACKKLELLGESILVGYTTLAARYCVQNGLDASRVVFVAK